MKTLYCKEDLVVERKPEGVMIYHIDGQTLLRLSPDTTSEQAMKLVDFMNIAYDRGFDEGQVAKASEICRALGL